MVIVENNVNTSDLLEKRITAAAQPKAIPAALYAVDSICPFVSSFEYGNEKIM
jgi:hypothetical protein